MNYMNSPYWLKRIIWFFQRAARGWADNDVWDAHDYLARIIPALIRKIQRDGSGCPSEFFDHAAKMGENPCAVWHAVLEEIAQGFEAALWLDSKMYQKFITTDEGASRLELDYEAQENAIKKMNKGLALFAKHYLNLWD